MKTFFRRVLTPWRAEDCFDSQTAYFRWLEQCTRIYSGLRLALVVAAVLPLLIGYIADRHWIMLLTILPLLLVLLLTMGLERMEAVQHGQAKK